MPIKYRDIEYLKIIKDSLSLAWRKKYLWWFGFFSSLGTMNIFFSSSEDKKELPAEEFSAFLSQNAAWIYPTLALLALIVLLLIFLSFFSRGALIKGIEKELDKKTSGFKKCLRFGKNYFWKIFLLNLTAFLFLFVISLILIVPISFLFLSKVWLAGIILLLIGILIFIFLFLLTYFLLRFGHIYLVIGRLSFYDAVEKSYLLLKQNIPASLIMLAVVAVSAILSMALIFLIFCVLFAFFALVTLILSFFFKTAGFAAAFVTGLLVFLAFLFPLMAFYEVFLQTAWILFFEAIAKPKAEEKIAEEVKAPKTLPEPEAIEGI